MISLLHQKTVREAAFFRTVVFFALLLSNLYLYFKNDSINKYMLLAVCLILTVYSIGIFLIAWIEELFHTRLEVPYAKYMLMASDLLLVTGLGIAVAWTSAGEFTLMGNQFYFTYLLLLLSTMLRNDPRFSVFSAVTSLFLYSAASAIFSFSEGTVSIFPWETLVLNCGGLTVAGLIMFWTTRYVQATRIIADNSRSLFEGVAHNLPGIIFQLEINEELNSVEPRFIGESAYNIFGLQKLKRKDVSIDALFSGIFGENEERLKELALKSLSSNEPLSFEFQLPLPKGPRWFRGVISPSFFHQGRSMVNGLLLDIDDHKKSQAELEKAKEEAESANRIKSDFLANMSHELRTPLNGVIGMVDILLDSNLNDEQSEYSETIRSSAEALLFIINDVLDFAKLEAGKLRIEKRTFDFYHLIQVITETFYVQAREKGVCLYMDYDAAVPDYLISDDNRIKQILYNLVSNAVKFTNEGWVIIRLRLVEESDKEVRINFCVEDTGIGIAKDKLRNIFKKFTQADTSITRKYGGTGLGLSISRELVSLLGGELHVNSSEGHGAAFDFSLQLQKDTLRSSHNKWDLSGLSILLIDSDFGRRESIKKFLSFYNGKLKAKGHFSSIGQGVNCIVVTDGNISEVCLQIEEYIGEENLSQYRLICSSDVERRVILASTLKGKWSVLGSPVNYFRLLDVITTSGKSSRIVASEKNNAGHRAKVLLAEDNPVNQKVLEKMLDKLGCSVDIASTGIQALELSNLKVYDVIFMDCQMPQMDGLETVKRLRERGVTIPVVALTGHALPGDRDRFIAAGMSDYLSKPVKANDLRLVLSKWIPRIENVPVHSQQINIHFNANAFFDPETAKRAIAGTDEDIAELCNLFIDDNISKAASFLKTYNSLSKEEINRFFHRIKGAGTALHAHPFVKACEYLELHADEMSDSDLKQAVEEWEQIFKKLVSSLEQWIEERT